MKEKNYFNIQNILISSFVIFSVILFSYVYFYGDLVYGDQDFRAYYAGAINFLDGNSPYTSKEYNTNLMGILTPFHDILDPDDHYRITVSMKDGNMEIYNDNLHFHYNGDIDFNDEFIIDVNGRYVQQTLLSIKDDKLLMKFSDANGVLIFDSANYEDQKSLVTPIKRR